MEEVEKEIMPIGLQKWKEEDPIMVSVLTAAYNHEKFIEQALKGFLMQRTNFRVELIVNDDASTDGTAEVIKRYEHQYPNLFVTFYQEENQYSQGKKPIPCVLYPSAKGKYIALCEGDDYWLDELKLQKQVDYLKHNEDCSLCFHPTHVVNDIGERVLNTRIGREHKTKKYETKDLFFTWFIPTASVVFRNRLIVDFPTWFLNVKNVDLSLFLLVSKHGTLDCVAGKMSAYRRHPGGVTYQLNQLENFTNLIYIFQNAIHCFGEDQKKGLSIELKKAIEARFSVLVRDTLLNSKLNAEMLSRGMDVSSILKIIRLKIYRKMRRTFKLSSTKIGG